METIKDYIINILKKDGLPEDAINIVLQMSEERFQWFKDVAWNLARVTGKYDRLAIYKELSILEKLILIKIETEETKKWNEELELERQREHNKWLREQEEWQREQEEWWREQEEWQRKNEEWWREQEAKQASASLNYLFPIGEA